MPRIEDSQYPVEDLNDLRLFINEKGRPTSDMTEKVWQLIFAMRKERTIPYIDGKIRRMVFKQNRNALNEFGEYNEDTTTDWKRYCDFINEVLRDIRIGKVAICFYYYQIVDLLRFHKDDLMSRYNKEDTYWEVWLDNGQNKN